MNYVIESAHGSRLTNLCNLPHTVDLDRPFLKNAFDLKPQDPQDLTRTILVQLNPAISDPRVTEFRQQ